MKGWIISKYVFIIKRQCSSDNNTESTVPFNSSKGLSGPIESFSSAFSTKVSNLLTRVDKLSTSPTRGPRFLTAVYVQCRSFAKHCSQGLPLEHFDFRCRHEIHADIRHGNTAQFLPMISARGEPWGDRILGRFKTLNFIMTKFHELRVQIGHLMDHFSGCYYLYWSISVIHPGRSMSYIYFDDHRRLDESDIRCTEGTISLQKEIKVS